MNYCKDCKFFRPAAGFSNIYVDQSCLCPGPQPWVRELVSGEIIQYAGTPAEVRKDGEACGFDGIWFQPKPTICKPEEVEQTVEIQAVPANSLVEICKFPYLDKTPRWKIW